MGMVRLAALLGVLLLVAACSSGERSGKAVTTSDSEPTPTTTVEQGPLRLKLTVVAKGLEAPVDVTSTPSEPDRLYLVEQSGRILVVETPATFSE